jgi:hypothetical protein
MCLNTFGISAHGLLLLLRFELALMPPISPRLPSTTTSPGIPPTLRKLTADDRLENIRRILELCKGIVGASGASQLSGAFGVLDTVLQNVQVSDA